jgi:hypothetical protein
MGSNHEAAKNFNNFDQSCENIGESMFAVNDPECQLSAIDLVNVFKKNLEMLRDDFLKRTEANHYFDISNEFE